LWQLDPEKLLELKRPGLLPLIGQTKIENPDELIPHVYAEIKSVPNEEAQHKLLTELLALLQDKEIIEMVESLIERDEWVLDTEEYRNLVRRQTRQAEVERSREIRRQDILNQAAIRYDLSMREGLRLQKCLSTISDDEKFSGIFEAVVQIQDFEQFYTVVEDVASEQYMMASAI